jgi:uncharacterized protein (DUF1778 family)
MNNASQKQERLEIRLTSENKKIIEEAAAILGQTVSGFTQYSLVTKAMDIIKENNLIRMSAEGTQRLFQILDEEAKPNDNLRKAALRYRSTYGD